MLNIRARAQIKVGKHSHIDAEIISFEPLDKDNEHIALVFHQADKTNNKPIIRIHSECLTGDVFNSSRCDCGNQLDEAVELMGEKGGILLYLRQEGRGIGLYNKLDAYVLQQQGMNTYQANQHLGFEEDARDFEVAADMLKALSVEKVKLMTNNPRKVKSLEEHGINVDEVLATGVYTKPDNEHYLETKKSQGNHMF